MNKKNASSVAHTTPKKPAKAVIGGQPENDQDARDAGLSSATSSDGERKSTRRAVKATGGKRR